MPPAAISRSRTYLPKIWGNIAPGNRSALAAVLLLCGCRPAPEPDHVAEVRAHLVHDEANDDRAKGLSIELTALGDFEASTLTSDTALDTARGFPLRFPASTRAVSATAVGNNRSWRGLDEAEESGNIDFLLWRGDGATPLWPFHDGTGAALSNYPPKAAGVAMGWLPNRRLLLIAGGLVQSADAARAVSVNLSTADAAEIADGMLPPRAYASVTPFGPDALLVAGGVDPTASADPTQALALDTASVFDAATGRFDRVNLVQLAQARARHGAVTLASGETLLVGGEGQSHAALATLEAISPADRAARVAGLASLSHPRTAPHVLRLDDGRIFVGGGSANGAPVSSLEWLSDDASSTVLIQENVVLASSHDFVAMPGGSVLGVGVCVPKQVASCTEAVAQRSVAWVRRDGTIDVLAQLDFAPDAVWLVTGSEGAPWLVAKRGSGAVFRRFDPWNRLFDELDGVPDVAPDAAGPPLLAVDAGAFVWLESTGSGAALAGYRHDTRGRFARDVAPLLLTDVDNVAPNRAPTSLADAHVEYAAEGLGLRDADALAVVADTTYADFSANLVLGSGAPPVIVLGDTRLGDASCPWPTTTPAAPNEPVSVQRRGTRVTLERDGARSECTVPSGRFRFGLSAASAQTAHVRSLALRRH